MLRRLEKGINNAKLKSQLSEAELDQHNLANGDPKGPHVRLAESARPDALHFDMLQDAGEHRYHNQLSGSSSMDEDDNDAVMVRLSPIVLSTRKLTVCTV